MEAPLNNRERELLHGLYGLVCQHQHWLKDVDAGELVAVQLGHGEPKTCEQEAGKAKDESQLQPEGFELTEESIERNAQVIQPKGKHHRRE